MEVLTVYVPVESLVKASSRRAFKLELLELKQLGVILDFSEVVAVRVSRDQVLRFQAVMEFDGASVTPQQPVSKKRRQDED